MKLKESFQILKKNFFRIAVFDILFVLSLYLLKIFFIDKIKDYILIARPMVENLQNALMQTNNITYSNIDISIPILDKILVLIILFFVLLFLCYNVFQGIAWSLSYRNKLNLRYVPKFLVLNLIFLLSLVGVNFLFGIYGLIFLVIGIYFLLIMYVRINDDKLIKSIKESFKFGVKKIHKVLLSYLVVVSVLVGISILLGVLRMLINNVFINIIVFLVFVVWSRIFLCLELSAGDRV